MNLIKVYYFHHMLNIAIYLNDILHLNKNSINSKKATNKLINPLQMPKSAQHTPFLPLSAHPARPERPKGGPR